MIDFKMFNMISRCFHSYDSYDFIITSQALSQGHTVFSVKCLGLMCYVIYIANIDNINLNLKYMIVSVLSVSWVL